MLLTGGGLGVWVLIDIVLIASGDFTDSDGKYLVFMRGRASPLKLIFLIVGSVMAAILCYVTLLIAIILCFTNPMTNAIYDQLSALQSGDTNKAYSYMASEKTTNVSLNDFNKFIQRFPIMSHYKKASFPEHKYENDNGYVKGTLKSNDNKEVTVEYLLLKENKIWKIVAIHMGQIHDVNEEETSDLKTFTNNEDHYSIQYPGNWYIEQTNKHSVMFSGKEGTPSYDSSINIQVMPSKSAGGKYENVKAAIDDLKNQITTQTTDTKFLDSGSIELPKEPKKTHGEYFIVTYTYNGHNMKKMEFMIAREGQPLIYSWGYTTAASQYEKDLPVAKSMFESWKVE
jgi:hypothetical protein